LSIGVLPDKKLHLRHLSLDCLELCGKAYGMIEVNMMGDPLYHSGRQPLGLAAIG
jgi:SulP family sulfate permease